MDGVSKISYVSSLNELGRLSLMEQLLLNERAPNTISGALNSGIVGIQSKDGSDINLTSFLAGMNFLTGITYLTNYRYYFGKYSLAVMCFPKYGQIDRIDAKKIDDNFSWLANKDIFLASFSVHAESIRRRIFPECPAQYYSESTGRRRRVFLNNIISNIIILNESPIVNPLRYPNFKFGCISDGENSEHFNGFFKKV